MADAMSSQRHIDKLNAPIVVTYGKLESPDFQRQSRDFGALVKTAGKPVQLIEAPNAITLRWLYRSAIHMAQTAVRHSR